MREVPNPDENEARQLIARLLVIGHVEYHPDDLHLPPDERRLRLTPAGEREKERLERQAAGPPV